MFQAGLAVKCVALVAIVGCSMPYYIIEGSAESNCRLSHFFRRRVLEQVNKKLLKKDVGLQLEMAVMEQHGNYVFTSYR